MWRFAAARQQLMPLHLRSLCFRSVSQRLRRYPELQVVLTAWDRFLPIFGGTRSNYTHVCMAWTLYLSLVWSIWHKAFSHLDLVRLVARGNPLRLHPERFHQRRRNSHLLQRDLWNLTHYHKFCFPHKWPVSWTAKELCHRVQGHRLRTESLPVLTSKIKKCKKNSSQQSIVYIGQSLNTD